MAYKKTYRRKTYRKRRNNRYFNTNAFTPENAWSLAKTAAQDIWMLKGLVNSEMLHNQSLGSTTSPNTGTITLLNGMSQGDTSSARTGNSILMRNVHLRLAFTQHATPTSTIYRVMLVLDKQQIADTTPAITDILESASPFSPLATNSVGRFTIMKNWFFGTDDQRSNQKLITYFKDFRFHTKYNGTAGTDIQKNGLYLVTISDQPGATAPTFQYSWKVGYHDN